MQIRQVVKRDGGNHLVSENLQYRKTHGEAWSDVDVVSDHDANLADMLEGLIKPSDFAPYGDNAVKYWQDKIAAHPMTAPQTAAEPKRLSELTITNPDGSIMLEIPCTEVTEPCDPSVMLAAAIHHLILRVEKLEKSS